MLKVSVFLACVLGAVINAEGDSGYDNYPPEAPLVQGTVRTYENFSAADDARALFEAMKLHIVGNEDTDETAIINILAHRSNYQRQEIMKNYSSLFPLDLLTNLRIKLTGYFYFIIEQLMMTPAELDAFHMFRAMKGLGTDDSCIAEILSSRNNRSIEEMKTAYEELYSKDLEFDLLGETSGYFKNLCFKLLKAERLEGVPVNMDKAKNDAQTLFYKSESSLETAESNFIEILISESYEQLKLVFQEYRLLAKKPLKQSINDEMSGDLKTGLLSIVNCVENMPGFFAQKLYHSMKGLGTNDEELIRIVISRSEVDMVQIKQEFKKQFGETLESWLEDELSYNYKNLIMALVKG